MKLLTLILSAIILISCVTKNEKNNSDASNQFSQSEKNQIIQNYSSPQKKDSISGKGEKAIPVKLHSGVAIIELKVVNNFEPGAYSIGVKIGTNIILTHIAAIHP